MLLEFYLFHTQLQLFPRLWQHFFFYAQRTGDLTRKREKVGPYECNVLEKQFRVGAKCYPLKLYILFTMTKEKDTKNVRPMRAAGADASGCCRTSRGEHLACRVQALGSAMAATSDPNRQYIPIRVIPGDTKLVRGERLDGVPS